ALRKREQAPRTPNASRDQSLLFRPPAMWKWRTSSPASSGPGLTEEYTVSMDGARQDFIIEQRPVGAGPLRVELEVAGAKVEPLADVARLVLGYSGRKIAYSRLRVTDATGKELTSRMELVGSAAAPAAPVNASLTGEMFDWEVSDEGVEHDTRSACAPQLAVVVNDAA